MSYDITKSSRSTINKRIGQLASADEDVVHSISSHDESNPSSTRKAILYYVLIFLVVTVIAFQSILIIYFVSGNQLNVYPDQEVLSEISQKVALNSDEVPLVSLIVNVDSLKSANEIQKDVYKDAQNGDYVLIFSGDLVIYRKETGSIIYKGPTPAKIANDNQQNLVDKIVSVAKKAKVIPELSTDNPVLSVIDDIDDLKKENKEFYQNVENGDIQVIFPKSQTIFIYRASEDKIISSATYQSSIKTN